VQIHIIRPRGFKQRHVFKVLIHIDVEDLLIYHFPREELLEDGKVPWKEFTWQYSRADGDLQKELHPLERYCAPEFQPR
jgi:hypothetical protein